MLASAMQWVGDRGIALFHAAFNQSGFNKAVQYYQFLAKVSKLESPSDLQPDVLKDKDLNIKVIEEHMIKGPNTETKLYLFNGGFDDIANLLTKKEYQIELVNPANSRVPGGAVRRGIGTLDEHLSRCSIMQDTIRFSLYDKVNKIDNQAEKASKLKVLNDFYGLSDHCVKLAKRGELEKLSWFRRATLLYSIVIAERALIHSDIAKIDPGEYERNNEILMWTLSKHKKIRPIIVDFSHIVAPDLRWMTGSPYTYKSFPFLGTRTNLRYENDVKKSLRQVIERAEKNRVIVFPAFGCGAFLGDPTNFSNILVSVLQEPKMTSQIAEKNITISLGLIGGTFDQISRALKRNGSEVKTLNKKDFPHCNVENKYDQSKQTVLLMQHKQKLKQARKERKSRVSSTSTSTKSHQHRPN